MRGLPQKQNARRAYKIRLCGHLRRYKKIVKKTYIIYYRNPLKFSTLNFFNITITSPALFLYYIIICKKIQLMPYFFYGTKLIHSFSPETKKRHQISLDGHKTKAIPIFNVVVFIHFPSKKACPKSSAAPFRQNRPLSFRNHRSEAPADSGYILLKSDRIFQKLRSVQSGKDE